MFSFLKSSFFSIGLMDRILIYINKVARFVDQITLFIAIAVFLFLWLFGKKIVFYFLKKVVPAFKDKDWAWKKTLRNSINHLILATLAFYVFHFFFDPPKFPIFRIWISVAFIWFSYALTPPLTLWVQGVLNKEKTNEYKHLFSFIEKTLQITIVLVGGVFIIQNMGFNVTSVLAGLGVGGVAIALAAKDTVANIFGSLVIAFDRPFVIGDWVQLENGTEGTVEYIGLRSTSIKTFYDSIISIPNFIIANSKIDNLGKRQFRRTRFTLGINYSTPADKIEHFIQGIKTLIHEHPKTKKDYYQVSFSGYSDSSLSIFVNLFLKVNDWNEELDARQKIFLDILKLAQKENVEFAFPSQSLYIEQVKNKNDSISS